MTNTKVRGKKSNNGDMTIKVKEQSSSVLLCNLNRVFLCVWGTHAKGIAGFASRKEAVKSERSNMISPR